MTDPTALSDISQMVSVAIQSFPAAGYNEVLDATRWALREFCRRTLVWRTDLVITTAVDGDGVALDYDPLDHGIEGAEVFEIVFVRPLSSDGTLSRPLIEAAYRLDPATGRLVWVPPFVPTVEDVQFNVRLALVGVWRTSLYPAWLMDRWGDKIVSGATGRLFELAHQYDGMREARGPFWSAIADAQRMMQRENIGRESGASA